MTHQLTIYDAYVRAFTGRVIARGCRDDADGVRRQAVALDQTAFYPTSGGQPYDTGVLGGVRVVDVQKDADGTIWHLLDSDLPDDLAEAVNDTSFVVSGEIDWDRRFDHMQQHTGQHMLSAVFEDLLEGRTIGFHLGRDSSTIDLDLTSLTWDDVHHVEDRVNEVIWQNLPVDAVTLPREDALALPLRKPPEVEGDVRVVQIRGVDVCACGGTHVERVGDIGSVKVTAVASYKGRVRVSFLCGRRALAHTQRTQRLLQIAGLALSVGSSEVPAAITRLQEDVKSGRRDLRKAREELATYEAEALWHQAAQIDGMRVVLKHWPDHPFAEARTLAARLCERSATVVLLAVTETKGVRVVCARSDDLPDINANELLREVLGALGGRGGGPPAMAQGGAPACPADEVVAALAGALATLR